MQGRRQRRNIKPSDRTVAVSCSVTRLLTDPSVTTVFRVTVDVSLGPSSKHPGLAGLGVTCANKIHRVLCLVGRTLAGAETPGRRDSLQLGEIMAPLPYCLGHLLTSIRTLGFDWLGSASGRTAFRSLSSCKAQPSGNLPCRG